MRSAARQAQEVGLPTVGVVANYERGCSTVFEDRRLACEMLWGRSAHKVIRGRHFAMPLTPSFVDPELLSFMFAPGNTDLFFTSTLAHHTAEMVRDTDKRSYGFEAPFSLIGYSEQLH